MGRMVKNYELKSRSYTVRLPLSNNSIESSQNPVEGQIRYNTSVTDLEVYYNNTWNSVSKVGRVSIIKDEFLANGITSAFSLTNQYMSGQEASVIVFVNGVYQYPVNSYTFAASMSNTLTFTTVPDNNSAIIVLENFNSTLAQ